MPGPHQRVNQVRSQIRSRIENVIGDRNSGIGLFIKTIGLARARTKLGLASLAHNMRRLTWLECQRGAA